MHWCSFYFDKQTECGLSFTLVWCLKTFDKDEDGDNRGQNRKKSSRKDAEKCDGERYCRRPQDQLRLWTSQTSGKETERWKNKNSSSPKETVKPPKITRNKLRTRATPTRHKQPMKMKQIKAKTKKCLNLPNTSPVPVHLSNHKRSVRKQHFWLV